MFPLREGEATDERNAAILRDRTAARMALYGDAGPLVGDWIIFADGVRRRVSYDWGLGDGDDVTTARYQTSDPHAGYYLHESGAITMGNGSLYTSIPGEGLTLTAATRHGVCWFFSHNLPGAGRAVNVTVPCRVWTCDRPAPTY